ncbi:formate dehydrogenase accessory sulfurtransferase FdhD [Streptomyces sp. SCUT-3]|uniref:formate dehydrogenase accessory sulfurtransferase FdhD n=1 Tax=Streptomyces TaxID=1883 RepID=UPI000CB0D24E|nr:formate dehydrogenase accessory sulfurtransferase FdhD [Streptomyces sp. SCUT-3]PLW66156.1 sulfurtransferase FdhD [Streptomyces sp. DJ]QMV22008.1 formate dehydrogenase accessory sulfurtransferase FdhD [Streptomyces sp. SCUT-3]
MARSTIRRKVLRLDGDRSTGRPDSLAAEEPLEIRIGGTPLTVTMRTPGHDFDLMAGFLVGEGVITRPDQLRSMRYCAGAGPDGANTYNVLDAVLAPGTSAPLTANRSMLTTSGCGICGKDSIEAVRLKSPFPVGEDPVRLTPEVLYGLPDALRAAQRAFDSTGGLHAAGLFTADGRLLCAREDVGRHNAVDKVVGQSLREGLLPLSGRVLMVSGRASFELTQKAAMAGVPVLAAVSAPSSLAVELAEEVGLTLVGFLRGRTANVYTHPHRVAV